MGIAAGRDGPGGAGADRCGRRRRGDRREAGVGHRRGPRQLLRSRTLIRFTDGQRAGGGARARRAVPARADHRRDGRGRVRPDRSRAGPGRRPQVRSTASSPAVPGGWAVLAAVLGPLALWLRRRRHARLLNRGSTMSGRERRPRQGPARRRRDVRRGRAPLRPHQHRAHRRAGPALARADPRGAGPAPRRAGARPRGGDGGVDGLAGAVGCLVRGRRLLAGHAARRRRARRPEGRRRRPRSCPSPTPRSTR